MMNACKFSAKTGNLDDSRLARARYADIALIGIATFRNIVADLLKMRK